MDANWNKKLRIVTFSLIFSGALNIGLLAALIVSQAEDQKIEYTAAAPLSTQEEFSNREILQSMAKLSFRELVTLLTNRELVEEGYAKRNLALSALVAFHHFNVEKALGSSSIQKRTQGTIELYPDLSEEQFAAIIRYAYLEKWPLTTKGLFALLPKLQHDESLQQAFAMTPEFYALQILFQKTEAAQEVSTLLHLASEGSWDILDRFAKEQAQLLDLSVEKRRRLLLSYLAHKSPTAAALLLKTDFQFVLKRFDDHAVQDLVSLLDASSPETQNFCLALQRSARSDNVREKAAPKVETSEPLVEKMIRYHVVNEGESLWKIAKQYQVKVEEIVQLNGIDKDRLFPGMTLKIP